GDDFRYQAARELGAEATALAGRMPGAEQQRRRRCCEQGARILRLGPGQAHAEFALHEWVLAVEAVAQDGVVHAVRRVERGDLGDAGKLRLAEIDGDVRQGDRLLAYGGEQRLLEPVGLALHAVDEHAPSLAAVDAPALEHMAGALAAPLFGISRRENLVPLAPHRL